MTAALTSAQPASTQFGDVLTAAAADLVAALPGHQWLAAMASGSLPDEAFGRWTGQRWLLISWQRQALMTLRSYNPPAGLERWLSLLADEAVRERRLLAHTLEQMGARIPSVPLPTCLGYGAYTRCCAADGLIEGLTVLYATQRSALEAWAGVPASTPVNPARRPWVCNWAAPEFREVVTGLGQALTELADQPGPRRREPLKEIFTTCIRYELAFWEMSFYGEKWTEPTQMPSSMAETGGSAPTVCSGRGPGTSPGPH